MQDLNTFFSSSQLQGIIVLDPALLLIMGKKRQSNVPRFKGFRKGETLLPPKNAGDRKRSENIGNHRFDFAVLNEGFLASETVRQQILLTPAILQPTSTDKPPRKRPRPPASANQEPDFDRPPKKKVRRPKNEIESLGDNHQNKEFTISHMTAFISSYIVLIIGVIYTM